MNISAKTEYACIAVLELAANFGSGEPVRIRSIAEKHGIPSRFLVQILLQLKSAGLVASTRGASGGYRLVKKPDDLSLGEVMAVIDGQNSEIASSTEPDTATSRVLLDTWRRVLDTQREMLAAVSFADLLEQISGQTEKMYYI